MRKKVLPARRFYRLFSLLLCIPLIVSAGCCLLPGPDMEEGVQNGQEAPKTQQGQTTTGKGGQQSASVTEDKLPGKQPAEAELAYNKARALWQRSSSGEVCSDPEQAVALLDKAIKTAPNYGEAYIRRGLAKSEMGEPEDAFEDATKGIRLTPSAEAYALRGLVLLRGRQPRAARRDLEYSLSKAPSQHLAHNLMGVLALSEENTQEACKSFKAGCSNGDCFFLDVAKKEKICP